MSYISFSFFIFLVCLLLAYRLTPDRHKWIVLLVFSLIFYIVNGQMELLFILGTSLVVYIASRQIEKLWDTCDEELGSAVSPAEKKCIRQKYSLRSKHVLLVALAVCVGYLCWCKYGAKALKVVDRLANADWTIRVMIPLGVSYYTFSSVGYLADLHWRKIKPEHSYPKLLLGMIYFPHIVEGPIARYSKFLPQLDKLTFPDYNRLCMGLQLMLWGMFKKLVIADRLNIFVNHVFGDIDGNWGFVFVIAFILAAFQAYTDFSGCMDIVTGVSDILGIQLEQNFNHPFFSKSAAEFWRRWHITLGNWFKNYVVVPITTSSTLRTIRRSASKRFGDKGVKAVMTIIPSGIVWFLTGIWHGNGESYIVWGMYWAVFIISSELLENEIRELSRWLHINTESKGWGYFRMVRTSCIYIGSLLVVTPGSLRESLNVFIHIVRGWNPWIFWDGTLYNYGLDRRNFMLAIFSVIFLLFVESLQERMNVREMIRQKNIVLRWSVYYIGILVVLVLGIYGPGYNAASFMYENF